MRNDLIQVMESINDLMLSSEEVLQTALMKQDRSQIMEMLWNGKFLDHLTLRRIENLNQTIVLALSDQRTLNQLGQKRQEKPIISSI